MNRLPKALIMIGHDLYHQGAKNSTYNLSEWAVNNKVAEHLLELNKKNSVFDIEIANMQGREILKYNPKKDGCLSKWEYENSVEPDCYLELHFNSAKKRKNGSYPEGCEMLHWHNSTKGTKLATLLLKNIVRKEQVNRGLKPKYNIKSRGGLSLGKTKSPAVILEPAFISSPWEARMIATHEYQEELATNILKSLFLYFK